MSSLSLPLPALPWDQALPPTRSAALARIDSVRPAEYARTRNHLEGAVTGLSPYLTHGLLTLPEVLARLLERQALAVSHKLVFEFGWREFFRHAWAHAGDGILQPLHPGPLPEEAYARTLPEDIRQGRTGVPVIDEAVRTLYASGTLHNHARMWLASYVVHLRRVHWRAGADWLVAHLLDGDLASNHLSWQWVAATGSHKPYLFNAENVARYAPAHWHSPGTVIDRSYEALELIARGGALGLAAEHLGEPITEPTLLPAPPPGLGLLEPIQGGWQQSEFALWEPSPLGVSSHELMPHAQHESPRGLGSHKGPSAPLHVTAVSTGTSFALAPKALAQSLLGREVWLVHPWALRAPPADLPPDAVLLGVYPQEHHAAWPWPEARWRWVDRAMAELTPLRCFTDAAGLAATLAGAARVRSVDDAHLTRWLQPLAELDPAPALFPNVERRCSSFSQWWTRATRGLTHAQDLL